MNDIIPQSAAPDPADIDTRGFTHEMWAYVVGWLATDPSPTVRQAVAEAVDRARAKHPAGGPR